MGETDRNPKDVIGSTKPSIQFVPMGPIFEASAVLQAGHMKYRSHNYRVKPIEVGSYVSAAFRHIGAYYEGEDNDPDDGLHHIAHAIAGLMILLDATRSGVIVDNRPPRVNHPFSHLFPDIKRILEGRTPPEPYTELNKDQTS